MSINIIINKPKNPLLLPTASDFIDMIDIVLDIVIELILVKNRLVYYTLYINWSRQ